MSQTVLLVDYENVPNVDLPRIPAHVQVHLFVGASQKNTTFDFSEQMRALGPRFTLTQISGNGKNALDFHIALYLGKHIVRTPSTEFIIFSKDTGFDPLVQHLTKDGVRVRRVATQQEAFPAKAPSSASEKHAKQAIASEGHVKDAMAFLRKDKKNKRPRKRASLLAHLKTHFSKKLSAAEVDGVVLEMFGRKLLSEGNGHLTYNF